MNKCKYEYQKLPAACQELKYFKIVFNLKSGCFLPDKKKIKKYSCKSKSCPPKVVEKIIGNLISASRVLPFGRPFIFNISFSWTAKIKIMIFDAFDVAACDVWLLLLKRNRGLPFDFVLGKLPKHKNEWFADASPLMGMGGMW